jgi:DNA-binding PadR family transcriptional regulator
MKSWLARRRRAKEMRVLRAITMLRPEWASAYPISRLAEVGSGYVFVILARLEADGRVRSEWGAEIHPGLRRRLYSLTTQEGAA